MRIRNEFLYINSQQKENKNMMNNEDCIKIIIIKLTQWGYTIGETENVRYDYGPRFKPLRGLQEKLR